MVKPVRHLSCFDSLNRAGDSLARLARSENAAKRCFPQLIHND